ncbi:MAG: SRPBCC family protein [Actinomycetota bacterium]
MLIENQFDVPAPVDGLWAHLLDVERVAPCMPGAELTETVDDRTWKGKVVMKFGPVSLSFAGKVTMEERDDAAHRVVLKAQGMEQKGKGAASANVTSWLEPGDGVTTVKMQADIVLSGFVAQISRGMLPDISARLTQEFADCLKESMSTQEAETATPVVGAGAVAPRASPSPTPRRNAAGPSRPPPPPPKPVAKPVGGIRLGLWALWRAIVRFFGRLFGRGTV